MRNIALNFKGYYSMLTTFVRLFFIACLLYGIWFLFSPLMSNDVHAQIASSNDCVWFGNVDPLLRPSVVQQRIDLHNKDQLTIYTDQDLIMSVIHLQNHCCDSWQLSDESCNAINKVPNKWYPESPFIVDQLMFIWMKKLDWVYEDCRRLWIDCVTRVYEVDPVVRRDEITTIAESTRWYPPSYIFELFRKTWIWNVDFSDIVSLDSPTLAKAYWAMCNDLDTLRFVTWIQSWSVDVRATGWNSVMQLCLDRIRNRYIQEENYVKSLQIEKWTQYFTDNLKAYLYDYFIDTRLSWLMWKYTTLDSCFQTILRYIQKTSCCNI